MGSRIRTALAVLGAALLTLTACGGDPFAGGGRSGPDDGTVVVGSGNFTESQILAAIYAQALEAKGVPVQTRPPVGSRETYIPALRDGSLDLVPEYTGTLLQYLDPKAPQTTPDDVDAALRATLRREDPQLTVLARAAAEDKDAVTVTRETAQRLGLRSIADLAPHCRGMVLGGPPEFARRPDGVPGLARNYGCTFASYRALDAGPLTITALTNGDIQAADVFTTDAAVPANDLVTLADPRSNFAAQNVVPLIATQAASPVVVQTLDAVSAKLTTPELAGLNVAADAPDKPSLRHVAKDWLDRHGLG